MRQVCRRLFALLPVGVLTWILVRRAAVSNASPRGYPSEERGLTSEPASQAPSEPQTARLPAWMRVGAWFIRPIAAPAWLLEAALLRLRGRGWEFQMFWSGTIYLTALIAGGIALILSSAPVLRGIGVYILAAVQLLGLIVVATVPARNLGGYSTSVRVLARRRLPSTHRYAKGIGRHMWAALTVYLYTVCFFAICGRLAYEADDGSFTGVDRSSDAATLFDFLYASFVAMTTLGYTPGMTPATAHTKVMYMVQFAISLAFVVLVFTVIVDQLVRRTQQSP